MTRFRVFVLALMTAGGFGASMANAEPQLGGRPPLNLGISSDEHAFTLSVAARFGGVPTQEIIADLRASGFECDGDHTSCTRARMDGPCALAWVVDFSSDGNASGRYVERCMGAEVDE